MWWLIGISAVIGLLRFFVPGHDISWPGTYEAMAHIWVGVLLALCVQRKKGCTPVVCLVPITVVEIIMFLLR